MRNEALNQLAALPISADTETLHFAWAETLALADRFRLTLYDACYLELAQRRGLPLASLDNDLRAAGRALGLTLLGVERGFCFFTAADCAVLKQIRNFFLIGWKP